VVGRGADLTQLVNHSLSDLTTKLMKPVSRWRRWGEHRVSRTTSYSFLLSSSLALKAFRLLFICAQQGVIKSLEPVCFGG